jgi:uncharacterized integral membrane protein
MIKVVKLVFLTLLFILGITFSMENAQPLVLRYYFGIESPPVPLFLLVFFSLLSGVLLAGVSFIIDQWSLKKIIREKEKQVASLESELKVYRERESGMLQSQTRA